jgi:hypothetical protein
VALLGTANTLGLIVATTIRPSAVDMMAIAEPEDLLASSVSFIENWPAGDDVELWVTVMASASEGVGAIVEFERPPEPEPEPGPGPEPEPEPEPEPIEPEPEYLTDEAEDSGTDVAAAGVGMGMILVLVGTCCVIVTGGVTAGLMWRLKVKSDRDALEPERIYEEKSWAPVADKYVKPKRHRRSDKDSTIKSAPKDLKEVARMMTPDQGQGRGSPGKGRGGRVSPGKKKLAKETKEQRRKRERKEMIAATRQAANGGDSPKSARGRGGSPVRQNARERQEGRRGKSKSPTRKRVPH